jgi:hypothetical protein
LSRDLPEAIRFPIEDLSTDELTASCSFELGKLLNDLARARGLLKDHAVQTRDYLLNASRRDDIDAKMAAKFRLEDIADHVKVLEAFRIAINANLKAEK